MTSIRKVPPALKLGFCAVIRITRGFKEIGPGNRCTAEAVALREGYPVCWVHSRTFRNVVVVEVTLPDGTKLPRASLRGCEFPSKDK